MNRKGRKDHEPHSWNGNQTLKKRRNSSEILEVDLISEKSFGSGKTELFPWNKPVPVTYPTPNSPIFVVGDESTMDLIIPKGSNAKHLIYGEGHDENRFGNSAEIRVLAKRTPELEVLDLRGVWDFTAENYCRPKRKMWVKLCTLILPSRGTCWEGFGKIFLGPSTFGLKNLTRLECPSEFLERATDASMFSDNMPNLVFLKLQNTTHGVLDKLPTIKWKLLSLDLGPYKGNDTAVDIAFLRNVFLRFKENLTHFSYSFPIFNPARGNQVNAREVLPTDFPSYSRIEEVDVLYKFCTTYGGAN